MISKHLTLIVFLTVVLLSVASVVLAVAVNDLFLYLLVASVVVNILVLIRNEQGGIVRRKEARRAHEPARHFNGAQTGTIVLLIMAEVGVGLYTLLT